MKLFYSIYLKYISYKYNKINVRYGEEHRLGVLGLSVRVIGIHVRLA
jgi:hypothetical protein